MVGTRQNPPRWLLWFLAASLVMWPAGMYWLANRYSGWHELRRVFDAGERPLTGSQGRTNVTLVQASGRRFDFASARSGQRTIPRTEVGVDEEGFWVRGVYGGWTGGPAGAIHVPWAQVRRCRELRVELIYPEIALIIHNQGLLDLCARQVGAARR